jgi:phosphoglycolate phosphatase-like HAD superfamily hydrolase
MLTTTGLLDSESIATTDVPPVIQDPGFDFPSSSIDASQPASRLRYFGRTQTAVSRRVRPQERRAVILGLEGVMVDSREAESLSWLVALYDSGHVVRLDLLRELSGMSAGELLHIATGVRASSAEGRSIIARQEEIFRTWYLPRILPFLGARRLLQRMKADGLRLIVLSSGSTEMAPELLRASGVASLVDDIFAADGEPTDAVLSSIVKSAMARCECTREGIVILGDCPYDVVAARRNGIEAVALRCGGWSDTALEGAVAVYQDHLHLLEQYPRSPFSAKMRSVTPQIRLARVQ